MDWASWAKLYTLYIWLAVCNALYRFLEPAWCQSGQSEELLVIYSALITHPSSRPSALNEGSGKLWNWLSSLILPVSKNAWNRRALKLEKQGDFWSEKNWANYFMRHTLLGTVTPGSVHLYICLAGCTVQLLVTSLAPGEVLRVNLWWQ